MSLYRVNLKHVVSQYYIGETKNNVARVFEVAQKTAAVWIFYKDTKIAGLNCLVAFWRKLECQSRAF